MDAEMDGEMFDLVGSVKASMHYALENFAKECKFRVEHGRMLKTLGYEPPEEPATAEEDEKKTSYLLSEAHPFCASYSIDQWETVHDLVMRAMGLWCDVLSPDKKKKKRTEKSRRKLQRMSRESEWAVNMGFLLLQGTVQVAKEMKDKRQQP